MTDYYIGLDFGTTNSIVSYLDRNGIPTAFKYGAPGSQQEYVPSFVAYEDGVEIGKAARTTAVHNQEIECYGNFKMRLPLPESEFANCNYSTKTPIAVTADYLRELLLSENHSFKKEQGEILGLVVSVPEIWQRDIYNLGRERLQKLITEELGLPLIQLVSEPVAAGAYYTWAIQQQAKEKGTVPFAGNLLVCDLGGGTVDVSLCRLFGDNKVEVLYFDGQGDRDLDSAGVAFDRRCVQKAYQKKHGESIDENDPKFVKLLREFEDVKIASHSKISKKFDNYFKDPENYDGQGLYTFSDGYSLSFWEVIEAFEPIKAGIVQVIDKVQFWLQENNQNFQRLFLVGGFSQFYLVQKAITETLGIANDDERFDRNFNLTNSAYAISYGACLIANGLIDPLEKYIHTLGIVINKEREIRSYGSMVMEVQEEMITLIQGGTHLAELNQPIFYERQLTSWGNSFNIPLWINPRTSGKVYKKSTPETITLPNYSEDARYLVGMRINSSQIAYLIIEEVHSQVKVEYELGDVLRRMFSGFYLSEE